MVASPRIACLECDLLLPPPALGEGERAACPRCGHALTANPHDGLQRSLAFAVAAAPFLAVALAFPFMSMRAGGFENSITLAMSAIEMYRNGGELVALLVLGFIVVLPAAMLGAVVALLVPLISGRGAPWLVPAGRVAFALAPWTMVEVFIIGVIVSLVKLAAMADIGLGISFWSYAAFTLCFTALGSSLDRMYVWDAIERVSAR